MIFVICANLFCLLALVILNIYVNIKRGDSVSDLLVVYTVMSMMGTIATGCLLAVMSMGV